jgi:hypothetical protein
MTTQFDMFGTPPSDNSLAGLTVKLDRPIDRERPCCRNLCTIATGKGPHAYALHCTGCGLHRGWLSKPTAEWIEHVVTRFGAPTTPIVISKAHTFEALPAVAGADGGKNSIASNTEIKMDASKYVGSKYLKVTTLKESGPFKAAIVAVERNEKYDKLDVSLDDGSVLSLNATNCGRLVRAYGAETDSWIDKEVELHVGELEYNGVMKEAVLVKPISPSSRKEAPAKPPFDDDSPFA